MSRFDNETIYRTASTSVIDQDLRAFMVRVYAYMAMGIGLTALVAFMLMSNIPLMMSIASSPLYYVALFGPLGIVMFLSYKVAKLQASTAQMLFWAYAALMGVSMSFILIGYKSLSVAHIFLISASLFGSMSLYGYTTKKDLTSIGSFLIMGVWGIVLASIINIFLGSSMFQMLISGVTVLVFTGLTAYDSQAIKEMYYEADDSEVATKKAVLGALKLYLDFVNIFISLLRLFGERK